MLDEYNVIALIKESIDEIRKTDLDYVIVLEVVSINTFILVLNNENITMIKDGNKQELIILEEQLQKFEEQLNI